MNIIGQKTVLRAIEPEDAGLLLELINDPETESHVLGWSFPVSMQAQIEWINSLKTGINTLRCIIHDPKSENAVGTVALSNIDFKNGTAGIHIKINGNKYKGKGYAFDAITTMVSYAFNELRLNCIYAQILSYNEASVKLFLKCGFHQEGVLRKRIFKKGSYCDVYVFSILKA